MLKNNVLLDRPHEFVFRVKIRRIEIQLAKRVTVLAYFRNYINKVRHDNQEFILDSYFHSQSGIKGENTVWYSLELQTGKLFFKQT